MKMKRLLSMRKALKDERTAKKLVEDIKREIAYNEKQYKERDKELKDLLKIISTTKDIINSKPDEN